MRKILPLDLLKKNIISLKRQGKKIVFTNGCFDILHYGHVKYLEDASHKGDCLVVAINSDVSVRRIKGNHRPIVKEMDRARVLAGLKSVDYVVIFKQETPLEVIEYIKPDILVKGADWGLKDIVGREAVLKYGGKVSVIRFLKGYSTTKLINKIAQTFQRQRYR
ncbi:MAG: D-glycero-beta-D-manno-heptose 1-phosphate adenylyltransferase [Candidatus Omnitrophota bacterium]|nr:D-glycero-beta-D-manno-heptose 1-phosphate adenylyltransferase [Candidatus Omnitrophota bacterium]MBU1929107.1 D-glycero-beta-D-manno-heptose 1-phosphate adenylyltransferase [Candidatus Omnitrophota bacterium]MBU1929142.1 D-glycero-beta-D-manno-heptose 1-phosphate adenylyltransferase [Candidatus Omnitrophota bacterium]MBU2035022.1 D-glycero-beta-D-manno-heptose 1-phosphate adenylyltransferase [Candidatus Omnitrophota bacterium]MBU2222022.1 D-glycero-beta-D-manno-heptose 1-phosphate adenylylt